mgnify:CR=1 FL=1
MRVLVVDDDTSIRLLLQAALEDEGYAVEAAANGREALDAILRDAPDLMLLDMAMPRMSGDELLSVLHERHVKVPAIVISAQQAAPRDGCIAAVGRKPFDLVELIDTVSRVGARAG